MSQNLVALQNRFLGQGTTLYDRLAQEHGAIDDTKIAALAEETGLPPAHVRTVAKFYDSFRTQPKKSITLSVCNGEACAVAGADDCRKKLQAGLGDADADVEVNEVTCLGYCGQGPNVWLRSVQQSAVFSLRTYPVDATIKRLCAATTLPSTEQIGSDFEEPQNRVYPAKDPRHNRLLRRMAHKDSHRLAVAVTLGAYETLQKALAQPATHVIDAVKLSQLRGRGGAGFPTGLKLETVKNAPSQSGQRYVVCNADEGDAGAYIDKELLERDPHTVLEGLLLAAYAVGANQGYIYLRGEYPRALRIFQQAMLEAQQAGWLGHNICNSGFSFELKLVAGHGAYICGEETSLLRSLEGVPAQVSPKPPFPAVSGLNGAPTAVNNVETLANLPWIVAHGGEAYAKLGYNKSRGTKLVSLNSVVARPGLYEVELGTTLRTIIFDLAGGLAHGHQFQAVQVGGPLGGILTERHLDLPLDFESLAQAGGMLGHAGIVVYTEQVNLVQIGRDLMKFCAVESCGKCFPCRIGAVRGTELFDRILDKKAEQADLELLAELNETMQFGSLCALGGAIPMPINNLLTWFIDAFRPYIPNAQVPERLQPKTSTQRSA